MPRILSVTEGALPTGGGQATLVSLSEAFQKLHGLTGNTVISPKIIGHIQVPAKGIIRSGMKAALVVFVEIFFNWLGFKRHQHQAPTLTAIFVAASAGEPMHAINSAEAIHGRGLQGDRYSEDMGYWKSIDGCQLTLITQHDLMQAKKGTGVEFQQALDNGSHRRNLVIDQLHTKNLEGRKFRIGTAVFSYDKPRPPCAYLDKVSGKGMCRALAHHSGVCLRVVSGGKLTVGDTVEIIDQATET